MANYQTTKNIILEKGKSKLWIGDDGMIHIKVGKPLSEKDVWELLECSRKTMDRLPGKAKFLIDLTTAPFIPSSQFRKKTAEKYKEFSKDPRWEKTAIFGGNVLIRTIASFILVASGIKKMKIFKTKKEALKWLKQP